MYGKLHGDMFTGSMMGTGALSFAVMGYIISNQQPNRDRTQFRVELRPRLLAVLIGEPEVDIERKIEEFCGPDPESRSLERGDETGGAKLKKEGPFTYLVINGAYYDGLRRITDKQEKDRLRQARFREKTRRDDKVPHGTIAQVAEWSPTPEQIRVGALFRRKSTTAWSAKEIKAWREIGQIDEMDLKRLEIYYRARLPDSKTDIRRRELVTLLNNFSGELDKARNFRESTSV